MSEHRATVSWERGSVPFTYETYVRDHAWRFPGGTQIAASAAPEFKGNPDLVDPEGALVAALSSCHMLTFLAVAARKRLVVESYVDEAVGYLEKNEDGKLAITRVVLRPKISFGDGKSAHRGGAREAPPRGPRAVLHRQLREDGGQRRAGVDAGTDRSAGHTAPARGSGGLRDPGPLDLVRALRQRPHQRHLGRLLRSWRAPDALAAAAHQPSRLPRAAPRDGERRAGDRAPAPRPPAHGRGGCGAPRPHARGRARRGLLLRGWRGRSTGASTASSKAPAATT